MEKSNKQDNKKNNNKKQLVLSILGVITLIIAVAGISYAAWYYVFNGTLVNTISTTDISLDLLESNTNIITIENALPMSDNEGKAQTQTFDFAVTSKTTKDIDIEYNINIEKLTVDNGYTSLNDNQIKVYLTDYNNTQKVAPTLISNLTNYKLYTGKHSHDATHETVQDKFKLRAWIDGAVDASSWTSSTKLQYKFKIGLTSEEKEKSAYPSVVYRFNENHVAVGDLFNGKEAIKITKQGFCQINKNDSTENSCGWGVGFKTQTLCENDLSGWDENNNYICSAGSWEDVVEERQDGIGEYTEDYTTLNKNIFLKHNISSEGTVENSEACYIINNTLYCLKGVETVNTDYDENNPAPYYEENTNILKTSFGESHCSVDSGGVYCSTFDLTARAYNYGEVFSRVGSWECDVNHYGDSDCSE